MLFRTLDLGPVDVLLKGHAAIDTGLETPGALVDVGLLSVGDLDLSRVGQRLNSH